ncbi:peroxiredoxin (Alkyl hydroperoxide reductase subunit C) [Puccinia sorghi]|uniref:Peroxiredoxin (Alkyl hydroperoxide reductase subunit C) n=1 Tax=Puccinia sorghi TaxID=27349 RepID=A0A0L6VNA0_9BASI|nr:peroxiredoxin (Alkyl hydroperoxide reductase subunit C) [Puccinia sorghi]
MPAIRLGTTAPDFSATTTEGKIESFHGWMGSDWWTILFSHPADFTPVCTTELGEVARRQPDFLARKTKVIGLSCNDLASHQDWVKDINQVNGVQLAFPIIADSDRKIATLYDMLDEQDLTNRDNQGVPFTVRSVFIIDPKKKVRLMLQYPASTGRHFDEIVRALDSLQLADKHPVTTPANWAPGNPVIVHPSVSTADAQKIFPNPIDHKTPYLRLTSL